jgi:hypothetical protein
MKAKITDGSITIEVDGTPAEVRELLAALRPATAFVPQYVPTYPLFPWYQPWGPTFTVTAGALEIT